jgi:hypothetical protein
MPTLARALRILSLIFWVAVSLLTLFLSPSKAFSQPSKKSSTSKSSAIPLAPCASFGNPKSCKTFNELLATHDSDFTDLQSKNSAYVCFRPSVDSFFRVNFQPFDKFLFRRTPSEVPEMIREAGFSFASYLDGQDNGYYNLMLKWDWAKGGPDTAEARPYSDKHNSSGIQSVDITETSIHIEVIFKNVKDDEVKQTIDIRRSTGRYSMDTSLSGEVEHEDGRCAVYPR